MRILITGNMGYVGPVVARELRNRYPKSEILGLDMGYFAHNLTAPSHFPESLIDLQFFGDVRTFDLDRLGQVDTVIHLAAISNDPMGNVYEDATFQVNHQASIRVANWAKGAGARTFLFASSCSVYGSTENGTVTEDSPVNPLTAYAKSKLSAEAGLRELASSHFGVKCFRFATACGSSPRLRLDLVLNDFVAAASLEKKIDILSDGTPWRPLIAVSDMARAFAWGVEARSNHVPFLVINAGSNAWNYQVHELAKEAQKLIPDVTVSVNPSAQPDKRSYRVSFDRFTELAPSFTPRATLQEAILDLSNILKATSFPDGGFRQSSFFRLKTLQRLREQKLLDESLRWA